MTNTEEKKQPTAEEKNLEFYNKYRAVPKNAMRPFDNGKFKGTDINTMWRIKCLTETFGLCGFGWYFDIIRTWIETTPNNEQFAFAEIKLYIKKDGEWSKGIAGTGGNKLTRITRDGDYSTSDEAFKMAITDAFGVACRSLGIGADVYWENDKTKYTEADAENKAKQETKKATAKQVEILSKHYTGENLKKLLDLNKVASIEEITMQKASELIEKIYSKKGDKNNAGNN